MKRVLVACLAGVVLISSVGATKRPAKVKIRKPVVSAPAFPVRSALPVAADAPTPAPVATPTPTHSLGATPNLSKAELEGLIFQRQEIMKQLETDSETLGNIAAGIEPRSKLAATTRAIATSARESRDSFKLHMPGGRSRPEVWTSYADYMQRMDRFVRETEDMARLGEAGEFNAVTEKLVTALPCKACHDIYRERKRPT